MRHSLMNHHRSRAARALLLGLGLFAFAGGPNAFAATVYSEGHADIRVAYEDDDFSLHYNFGSDAQPASIASQQVTPADIVVQVIDAPVFRPPGAQWNFTGAAAGELLWFLPQGQEIGKPFLGFSTELFNSGDWVGNLLWSLKSVVSSPAGGDFSMWQTDFFGSPIVYWDTADGIGVDDQFGLPTGTHSHYNWGFTQQGVYQLEFEVRGTHASDGLLVASDIFTFNVVPEPGSLLTAGMALGGLAFVIARRRLAKK